MTDRLIITNGDAAVARLREVEIEADFLPWRDVLHDGPAPTGLLLEALSIVRAQFLAKEFGRKLSDVAQEFAARDATARNHGQYARIELWFEHDLYDQLQLIQVLDFLASEKRTAGVALVQADDYLGTLALPALRKFDGAGHPVGPWIFEAARRAWTAFTASTPEKLARLVEGDIPALPFLVPALRRLLQELPAVASGLSLTEERILGSVESEPRTVAELFAATEALEPARFLGDLGFFRRLDGLAFVPQPLVAGLPFASTRCGAGPADPDYRAYANAQVRITETGRRALAGRFDHATENAINRWFGGTFITPKTMWRSDKDGKLALPPAPSRTGRFGG